MRVLIVSNGADNGGVGIAIKRAFAKHASSWTVNSVTRATNFIGFEPDVYWPPDGDSAIVDALYESADVVHIMDKFDAVLGIPACKGLGTKPMVMHHHGSVFRSKPQGFIQVCRENQIPALVATFDLLRYAPDELTWMPHPIDVDQMQGIRGREYRASSAVRIVQTPGAGDNATERLQEAVKEIDGAVLDVVRGLPWAEAMQAKARADIVFDCLDTGYGMTSVEAFAMRIPVVSGSDLDTARRIVDACGVRPYYSAMEENLGFRLRDLVESSELREEYAEIGWEHVNAYHAEDVVVDRLMAVYERVA